MTQLHLSTRQFEGNVGRKHPLFGSLKNTRRKSRRWLDAQRESCASAICRKVRPCSGRLL